ncbi:DUF6392 family protein [Vibrio owensii]|uniref:Pyocin immunity protein n=1 Tax=Vibrio owensii CAIM 1854 = LMG 25443 TaxID=1229493 RepID=A0A0C1Z711_9VIBR|nr:DUF6392 family protein [Vibrio owensii]KIF51924.1 hypothetical protein H735_17380 [Vibrio owensii CAIM 1854 = LMG 25443]
MDSSNVIIQIDKQKYDNFIKENLSNENYKIYEDSLNYRKISVSDDDLIFEFNRKSNLLFSVEINDLSGKIFIPSEPFNNVMNRSQVQSFFGDPINSLPPRKALGIQTGWIEQYSWSDEQNLSVLIYHTYESEVIDGLIFMPASKVSWGEER